LLTSHLSDLYPEGLLIGQVAGTGGITERDPMVASDLGLTSSYKVTTAFPASDWSEIREVLCLPVVEVENEMVGPATPVPVKTGSDTP
jgi:hypothetical protein